LTRRRGRNLTANDIARVVQLLDGWSGRVTWNLVIEAVATRLRCSYTRQALSSHAAIQKAFDACKRRPAAGKAAISKLSGETAALSQRLARREAEISRLEAENRQLLERFVVWAYNAQTRGLGLPELERPLPAVRRGQTKS
jgi:hypothetical protein